MTGLMERLLSPELRANPEYQSALVRLGIWFFSVSYMGLAALTGYYEVDGGFFSALFGGVLVVFLGLFVSVVRRPDWPARRYAGLVVDVGATSLAIFLTEDAISPFYLLYVWLFISYGTRYGETHLKVASVLSVLAYNIVLLALEEWQRHTFEAFFFLLLLVILPMYQRSLLQKVHEARAEAERANQAKSDFLATMTHELRTPLSGVIGMTRLLDSTRLDVEQRDYVHSISTSAQLLQALIGDVLDLSKIEARKLELESVLFDLRDLLLEVCNACESQALAKGLELICSVDPRLPRELVGDPLRLRQILFNLVGNAIKFTEHGEVLVRARLSPSDEASSRHQLCLEVRDTGIGISADKLAKVFDSFWQADDSTSRHYGGTGLGTTIARDLTRLMNGRIEVVSEVGRGSTFTVWIPLSPEAEVSAPDVMIGTPDDRRVLVYEPNVTARDEVHTTLDGLALKWQSMDSIGQLGRIAEKKESVALAIIADSPAGEDLEAVRGLLNRVLGRDVPVIYLCYYSRRRDCRNHHEHCINKPFAADRLRARVARILRGDVGVVGERTVQTPTTDSVAENKRLDVLVAEDNDIAGRVISALLDQRGHRVTLTRNGEETLGRLREARFDIAFVDLRMPRVDGLEFTRAVRSGDAGSRGLPIVALTANVAEDVKHEALAAGMDEFLTKPVETEALDAVLERFCGSSASGHSSAG